MITPEQLAILMQSEENKEFKRLRNPINNRYAEYCKEVQKLISAFHIDINGKYDKNDAVHKYLLNKLNKDINNKTDELFAFIQEKFDESIDRMYDSCYNYTLRSLKRVKQTDDLTKSAMKSTTIENPWSGVHYRERLDNHRTRLEFTMKSSLNISISRGDKFRRNYAEIHKSLEHQLRALDRLFKTEIGVVGIQAQLNCYDTNGIRNISVIHESVKVKTKNDGRVCSKCKPMHNKVVKVKDAKPGINVPKFHSGCRCWVSPVIEED